MRNLDPAFTVAGEAEAVGLELDALEEQGATLGVPVDVERFDRAGSGLPRRGMPGQRQTVLAEGSAVALATTQENH